MKLRDGFVSNSSSGSFIFPKGIGEYRAEEIIKKIELFLTDLRGEEITSGLRDVWDDDGKIRADTQGDNTCPYVFHQILEGVVGCTYEHYG